MINRPEEYEIMANAEKWHWWYLLLHEKTIYTLEKNFSTKTISILDAGCGTGELLAKLEHKGYKNIYGFDISDKAIEYAAKNSSAQIVKGDLKNTEQLFPNNQFDCIVCNDALYFLSKEEIKNTLSSFAKKLTPNGILIVNLPAYNALKGSHDKAVGINERFTKRKFKKLIPKEILISEMVYRHGLITPFLFLKRKLIRHSGSDIGSKKNFTNAVFYHMNKIFTPFQKISPFGSSVFAVLKKAGASSSDKQ